MFCHPNSPLRLSLYTQTVLSPGTRRSVLHHYVFLRMLCKCRRTVCHFLGLAAFTQHNASAVHPGSCMYQWFTPSYR